MNLRCILFYFILFLASYVRADGETYAATIINNNSNATVQGLYIYGVFSDSDCNNSINFNTQGTISLQFQTPYTDLSSIPLGKNFIYQQIWNSMGSNQQSNMPSSVKSLIFVILSNSILNTGFYPSSQNYACTENCNILPSIPSFSSIVYPVRNDVNNLNNICLPISCHDNDQKCIFTNQTLYIN